MRKVIVNFSGGADSTVAVLEALQHYPREEIVLVWEDTGAEYFETLPHIQAIARTLELPLVVIKAEQDFWARVRTTGYFPRPQYRFCTSRLKQQVFGKWVRQNRQALGDEVVIISGIRSDESASRFKMEPWREMDRLSLKDGSFSAWGWLPCFDMSKQEVFERIKGEGLPIHPAYDFATRLSCWCCIFAHPNEVRPYAEEHPELYEKACLLEDEIGDKWKYRFGFNDLFKQGKLL